MKKITILISILFTHQVLAFGPSKEPEKPKAVVNTTVKTVLPTKPLVTHNHDVDKTVKPTESPKPTSVTTAKVVKPIVIEKHEVKKTERLAKKKVKSEPKHESAFVHQEVSKKVEKTQDVVVADQNNEDHQVDQKLEDQVGSFLDKFKSSIKQGQSIKTCSAAEKALNQCY